MIAHVPQGRGSMSGKRMKAGMLGKDCFPQAGFTTRKDAGLNSYVVTGRTFKREGYGVQAMVLPSLAWPQPAR